MELISRRYFLEKSFVTAGLTTIAPNNLFGKSYKSERLHDRLPREIWIATVSQENISAETPDQMVQVIFDILKKSLVYHPDVVCLPEVFMTANIRSNMKLQEKADISEKLVKEFAAFALMNQCYVICPVYTRENGRIYNSAIVIDRQGNRMGEYRKMHITESEVADGVTPGPLQPPVFKTDFGIIGIQICFDIEWDDGWKSLRHQGAELVFWPSAFAGGKAVNGKAWQNKYAVVSSTWKGTTKICDITGEVIAQTGIWDRNVICAPVNLEKAFLHTWPYALQFDKIRAKYGRKIRIKTFHEEEWSIIESLSPDVQVNDILAECNFRTYEQLIHDAEIAQIKSRG